MITEIINNIFSKWTDYKVYFKQTYYTIFSVDSKTQNSPTE